jgi:hypothetical protein
MEGKRDLGEGETLHGTGMLKNQASSVLFLLNRGLESCHDRLSSPLAICRLLGMLLNLGFKEGNKPHQKHPSACTASAHYTPRT